MRELTAEESEPILGWIEHNDWECFVSTEGVVDSGILSYLIIRSQVPGSEDVIPTEFCIVDSDERRLTFLVSDDAPGMPSGLDRTAPDYKCWLAGGL